MNIFNFNVDVVQQFVEVFDLHSRTKEHHYFFVSVFSQESEQEQKSFFCRTNNVTL